MKWTQRTTVKIAEALRSFGIIVCPRTVAQLLAQMGLSLRVNHKKRAGCAHPDRAAQFDRINELREHTMAAGMPLDQRR